MGMEFTTLPSEQIVTEGEIAVFACQNPAADIIEWRINGTSLGIYHPPFVESSSRRASFNNQTLHLLSIHAQKNYNMTRVECEAVFLASGIFLQISPVVHLLVQGCILCIVLLDHLYYNFLQESLRVLGEHR